MDIHLDRSLLRIRLRLEASHAWDSDTGFSLVEDAPVRTNVSGSIPVRGEHVLLHRDADATSPDGVVVPSLGDEPARTLFGDEESRNLLDNHSCRRNLECNTSYFVVSGGVFTNNCCPILW